MKAEERHERMPSMPPASRTFRSVRKFLEHGCSSAAQPQPKVSRKGCQGTVKEEVNRDDTKARRKQWRAAVNLSDRSEFGGFRFSIGFRSSARVEQQISVSIRAIRGENRFGCGCAAPSPSVQEFIATEGRKEREEHERERTRDSLLRFVVIRSFRFGCGFALG
ncbi:MAG: hypothetical protein WD066_01370 [Planctomycetaceae bacterium]